MKASRAAALILGLLAACAPARAGRDALAVRDDAGVTVRLARPAGRVVSLIPATTELLFAIGAGRTIVGRTHWCDYPAEARSIPDLGDGLRPNLEAVAAVRPELVVLYRSAQNAEAAARLRALGIPAVQFAVDRLADVPRVARALGALTGRRRGADSLAAAFDTALAAATTPASPAAPALLLLAWDQPPMTIGAGSFLSEVVERAGARNLFGDLPAPSGTVSLETIATRDPDAILVATEGEPAFVRRPEWQAIRAVRERRLVRVTGSSFSRPSPRAPEAIRELRARLAEVLR
ncbi:MAG TPA: helical backbone metal receptor [Gemmatimonadales bacterium]|nr:helical backbone metal receptor [Gemmatimonadales bacterium]